MRRKAQEKRKAETKSQQLEKRGKFVPNLDEEITSEEEEEYKNRKENDVEEELEEETAQEKKVRLARQYLKQLQEQSKYIVICSYWMCLPKGEHPYCKVTAVTYLPCSSYYYL